jgi:hypothetical protein
LVFVLNELMLALMRLGLRSLNLTILEGVDDCGWWISEYFVDGKLRCVGLEMSPQWRQNLEAGTNFTQARFEKGESGSRSLDFFPFQTGMCVNADVQIIEMRLRVYVESCGRNRGGSKSEGRGGTWRCTCTCRRAGTSDNNVMANGTLAVQSCISKL